jgi:signal transduction histidine kinase
LAFVQKIIISHGGIIEVESREGEGTLFRVILSMAD